MKLFWTLCAMLLLLACAKMPIGYYTLLRIIITIGAISILFYEIKKDVSLFGIAFIMIAILFNPILPIYLYKRTIWMPIDISVAALFLICGFKKKQK
jgi:hypothetical protein